MCTYYENIRMKYGVFQVLNKRRENWKRKSSSHVTFKVQEKAQIKEEKWDVDLDTQHSKNEW